MPENLFDQLVQQAAEQLAGEGQIDLFLYTQIEDAGFAVDTFENDVLAAVENHNTPADPRQLPFHF